MKIIWLGVLVFAISVSTHGQQPGKQERMQIFNLSDDGVAIQGYDPVSYFTGDEPEEEDSEIRFTHEGVTYYFANEENRAAFKENPGKYEPACGGWCAYAMGEDGSKLKIDPETYKIIDEDLYLFYHTFWSNTLPKWKEKEGELKTKADQN